MGVLYVAEHALIGRRVAIKVINPTLADHPDALELFFREARAANQIQHPNIIQITDLVHGVGDAPTFLVMELLDGYTLREVLEQEKRLSPRRAAEIGAAIADAMAAAHRVGVIHRDLKPDNIFLCVSSAGPEVKVLDFGIAHLCGTRENGLPCGTPLYISPEQAGADGVDERSDIYSLGALLYEAVAGKPVFDYDGVRDLFVAHVAENPRPLGMPRGPAAALESVIMACLAKSADERPLSMQMIATHLSEITSGWSTWAVDHEIALAPALDDDEFTRRLDELWSDEHTSDDDYPEVIIVEHSRALPLSEPRREPSDTLRD